MQSMDETKEFAGRVVGVLREVECVGDRSVILTLSGPLGAGKTAFVKCLAEVLGVSEIVTSPSFVIRCDYDTADGVFVRLIHIDAYRLEDSSEVETIGWSDVLESERTLVVVEWPERVSDRIPEDVSSVSIRFSGDSRVFSTDLITTPAV